MSLTESQGSTLRERISSRDRSSALGLVTIENSRKEHLPSEEAGDQEEPLSAAQPQFAQSQPQPHHQMPSSDFVQSTSQAMIQKLTGAFNSDVFNKADAGRRNSLPRESSISSSIQKNGSLEHADALKARAPRAEKPQRTDLRDSNDRSSSNEVRNYSCSDGQPNAVYVEPKSDEEKDGEDRHDSQDSSNLIRRDRESRSMVNGRNESVQRSWMFRREAEEHYFGSIVLTNSNVRGSTIGSIIAKSRKEFATFVQSQDSQGNQKATRNDPYAADFNNAADQYQQRSRQSQFNESSNRRSTSMPRRDEKNFRASTFLSKPDQSTAEEHPLLVSKSSDREQVLLRIAEENSKHTESSPWNVEKDYLREMNHTIPSRASPVKENSLTKEGYAGMPANSLVECRKFVSPESSEKIGNDNFNSEMENAGPMASTNIATHHFSNFERLIFAITDDDTATFDRLNIPLEEVASLEFDGGLNILNFAIEQERVNMVQHLAKLTKYRPEIRKRLCEHRFGKDQISSVHQVMTIGNRALLDALLFDFEVSLDPVTQNGLTVMHCAAQSYAGYVSILVLKKQRGYDVNARDNYQATPLHFAIIKQEFMNVQLLIKFGADVNARDISGQAPLHIAVMRIAAEPDDFEVYKKIIKELLFNGANRSLETDSGHTPRDLLDEIAEDLEEADYWQLRSILTYSRPCLCFMRRRPIQKMERSPWTLIFGLIFNLSTITIYYFWLSREDQSFQASDPVLHDIHMFNYWTSLVLLVFCIPLFVASVILSPGYLTPVYDFTKLVEVALDIGLHLDNFCSYCEVIKSETSFHCTICNRCVELFDHHCPFINNCLGYRNHKYFLLFVILYSVYLLIILFETLRHFIQVYMDIGFACFETDSITFINLVLILLHMPVFAFQVHQQCGSLCKKPSNLPPHLINTEEYAMHASYLSDSDPYSNFMTKSNRVSNRVSKSCSLIVKSGNGTSGDSRKQSLRGRDQTGSSIILTGSGIEQGGSFALSAKRNRSNEHTRSLQEQKSSDPRSKSLTSKSRGKTESQSRGKTDSQSSQQQAQMSRTESAMKQPPLPQTKATGYRFGLTKSLLEQHEAYQEIDPNDEEQQARFIRERERVVRCNCTFNFKKIWTHRQQTQERLYKILFVRINNFDNSLYSTSRNATVFNFNHENLDTEAYNQSIYYTEERGTIKQHFATQNEPCIHSQSQTSENSNVIASNFATAMPAGRFQEVVQPGGTHETEGSVAPAATDRDSASH